MTGIEEKGRMLWVLFDCDVLVCGGDPAAADQHISLCYYFYFFHRCSSLIRFSYL